MMAFLKDSEAAPNMRPTAAVQQCALDPEALAAAQQNVGERFHFMIAHAIRAYLSALTPAEAGGLVERLNELVAAKGIWGPEEKLMAEAATALASERAAHAETKRALDEARQALEPFAAVEWTDEDGWSHNAPYRERVCDWFGPSDFFAARRVREGGKADG